MSNPQLSQEEFRKRVSALGDIFEVSLMNGTVLVVLGNADPFLDMINHTAARFVTIPVVNLVDIEKTTLTVAVQHIAIVSPTRDAKAMLGPDDAEKGVVWKNPTLN